MLFSLSAQDVVDVSVISFFFVMPLQFSCRKTAVLSEIMFSPLPLLSSKSTTERKTQTHSSSKEVQSQTRRSFCSLFTV